MSEQQKLETTYCGEAYFYGDKNCMSVKINLVALFEYCKTDEGKQFIDEFKKKDGTTEKSIKINCIPIKEPTKYKTHFAAINKFRKEDTPTEPSPEPKAVENDDLPF